MGSGYGPISYVKLCEWCRFTVIHEFVFEWRYQLRLALATYVT